LQLEQLLSVFITRPTILYPILEERVKIVGSGAEGAKVVVAGLGVGAGKFREVDGIYGTIVIFGLDADIVLKDIFILHKIECLYDR
jgi:hypothetical protein